jgi:hypothetical protein
MSDSDSSCSEGNKGKERNKYGEQYEKIMSYLEELT